MGVEIERKYLLANVDWRTQGTIVKMRQGYISRTSQGNVRVRIADTTGYITIKGSTKGISRLEYEYEIPLKDAEELLTNLCEKPLIEKNRHLIKQGNQTWEVDEFFGENLGLVVAEIELQSEDEEIDKPDWLGQEVTGIKKYYNASLISDPFCNCNTKK